MQELGVHQTTLSHAKFLQDSLPGFSVMSEDIANQNKGKEDFCNKVADKEGPVCTDEQGLRRAAWIFRRHGFGVSSM